MFNGDIFYVLYISKVSFMNMWHWQQNKDGEMLQ